MALTRLFMRSELMSVLWMFRRQLVLVGLLSMVANVLMLVPTIYMVQVYDRVLTSGSETALLFVSLLALVLFGAMSASSGCGHGSWLVIEAGQHWEAGCLMHRSTRL